MQHYYSAKEYDLTDSLILVLTTDGDSRYDDQAQLLKGKILLDKGYLKDAENQFRETEKNFPGVVAAEARYMTGYAFHLQNQFEESIETLLILRKNYENYPQWLYKGFLLIAENYIAQKNYFQAEATLKSIVDYGEGSVVKQARIRLKEVRDILAVQEAQKKSNVQTDTILTDSIE
jgi:TolA-binding protein